MGPVYVGFVPRTDRFGNGPYIWIEPHCCPIIRFEITNWSTRDIIHHGFRDDFFVYGFVAIGEEKR